MAVSTLASATPLFLSSTIHNLSSKSIRYPSNSMKQSTTTLNQKKRNLHIVSSLGLQGRVKDGVVFRENFCIRSYETGPHGKASIETIMNHMQETILDHLKTTGVACDGLGSTPGMCKKNLIWVMTKVQMVVDRYPAWGDNVQVDNWLASSGKNGMLVSWIFRDSKTNETLIKVSSIWMLMNKETRKLSKIPDEVRVEMDRCTMDTPPPTVDDDLKNWPIHANIANHVRDGLKPRWSDLDINQHVNNVKYIGWILESVPTPIAENYELASLTLEYRQECNKNSMLRSHTSVFGNVNGEMSYDNHVYCQHILQLEARDGGDSGDGAGAGAGAKIMKGKSKWRPIFKYASN